MFAIQNGRPIECYILHQDKHCYCVDFCVLAYILLLIFQHVLKYLSEELYICQIAITFVQIYLDNEIALLCIKDIVSSRKAFRGDLSTHRRRILHASGRCNNFSHPHSVTVETAITQSTSTCKGEVGGGGGV